MSKPRRVLVVMMSSHNHFEFVEVTVIAKRPDDVFIADHVEIEAKARQRMVETSGIFGPWEDTVDDFELITVLTSDDNYLAKGRVSIVKNAARIEKIDLTQVERKRHG